MICQKCGGNLKVESTEKYDTVNRRVLVCKVCGWASGTEETFIIAKPLKTRSVKMPESA
jgi:transcription elongation factor Elf1